MSIRIASRFLAVSTRVSPFCTALPEAATFTVSAESRFSANSKEMRVRVDASKNRLTIVLPRSAGTFLMGRSDTSLKGSAVSRTRRIWSAERCSRPTRSLPRTAVIDGSGSQAKAWARPCAALKGTSRPLHQVHLVLSVQLFDEHVHALAAVHLDLLAHDVGLDRQLAAAAVHQHAQRDALGAPEVGELVERGADGAAGVEHVVHDDDVFPREVARDAGLPDHGLGAHGLEVVAVQGDVEGAAGHEHALFLLDELGDPLGELDAAPLDADEDEIVRAVGQLEHLDRHTLKRPRQGAGVQDGGPFGPAHLGLKLSLGPREEKPGAHGRCPKGQRTDHHTGSAAGRPRGRPGDPLLDQSHFDSPHDGAGWPRPGRWRVVQYRSFNPIPPGRAEKK